jgi:hypothetical protein
MSRSASCGLLAPNSRSVTPDNFAESDLYFGGVVKKHGFGKFEHNREPTRYIPPQPLAGVSCRMQVVK